MALVPVTTGSSHITVWVAAGDPTMEGMAIWATGIKTDLAAMQGLRTGGTRVRHAAGTSHKLLYFFVWLMLHELTILFCLDEIS